MQRQEVKGRMQIEGRGARSDDAKQGNQKNDEKAQGGAEGKNEEYIKHRTTDCGESKRHARNAEENYKTQTSSNAYHQPNHRENIQTKSNNDATN